MKIQRIFIVRERTEMNLMEKRGEEVRGYYETGKKVGS